MGYRCGVRTTLLAQFLRARRKRKQERIDASLAQFDAERAYRGAEMALYVVSSQVEHLQRKVLAMVLRKVRKYSKRVMTWLGARGGPPRSGA